jgi:hypothetical protein
VSGFSGGKVVSGPLEVVSGIGRGGGLECLGKVSGRLRICFFIFLFYFLIFLYLLFIYYVV